MGKMNIHRKIMINADKQKVHDVLVDFNTWTNWSPWLICEPEAKVEVNSAKSYYSWEGKRVGAGEMEVTEDLGDEIKYRLAFLKPFKSKANVSFRLKDINDGVEVTWTMESKMPWFMFFMKKQMEAYVGMDYERGLKMLKDFIELGTVESSLEIKPDEHFDGCTFIGIKRSTTIEEMGDMMKKDFLTLTKFAQERQLEMNTLPFSQYHKFDFVSKEVVYTAGFPVDNVPKELSGEIITGNLPAISVNKVRHKGRYEHLGNAWAAQVMMQRNKEFKPQKNYHPFEVYQNSPGDTSMSELVVDICFAKK
ncbi:MAG: SRPBCC family protein [Flavobacteriales bacterium]|jgi:predicted transcriptional regulator YdeE|nr:SRPBCC family protein [Flavobacteriales bacterium]